MAQIPLGNFAQAQVVPRTQPSRVDLSPLNRAGDGAAALGQALTGASDDLMRQQAMENARKEQEADALNRAKATNLLADDELQLAAKRQDFISRMEAGGVDYMKAAEAWQGEVSKLPAPTLPEGMSPALAETFRGAVARGREKARLEITQAAEGVKRADFRAQIVTATSKIEQVAGVSGDAASAAARIVALKPLYLAAGFDEGQAAKEILQGQERVWTNQAAARINAADASVESLRAIDADLTGEGGLYLDKLDPAKRTALSAQVKNRIDALSSAAQHAVDKRESAAEKAVAAIDAQIASGVPGTPEMWSSWATITTGTAQEAAFKERVAHADEVQQVLRMPPGQQQTYIQQREAELLTGGGTVQQKQRLDTLRNAMAANAKQMRDEPLLYLQNRLQRPVEPLDFAGLQTGDMGAVGRAIGGRMDDLAAMRKQYGPQVQMKPLLPQEADVLVSALESLDPVRAGGVFKALRGAIGSDTAYQAVMAQIAPKAPLKAMAGDLAARPGGELAASLLLSGEALLNTKEGAPKWKMPADNHFQQTFSEEVGEAFQGRPAEYQQAYEAARAIYAGSASRDGDTDAGIEYDDTRMRNSIRAAVGAPVDFNGARTLMPWGMDEDEFEDRAARALESVLGERGADDVQLIGTRKPGVYVLARGRTPLPDPSRKAANGMPAALFIDITRPLSAPEESKAMRERRTQEVTRRERGML